MPYAIETLTPPGASPWTIAHPGGPKRKMLIIERAGGLLGGGNNTLTFIRVAIEKTIEGSSVFLVLNPGDSVLVTWGGVLVDPPAAWWYQI